MIQKKRELYMDETVEALENCLKGIIEINDCIREPLDKPNFVYKENTDLLKQHITIFKNRRCLILEKDKPYYLAFHHFKHNPIQANDGEMVNKLTQIGHKENARIKLIDYLNQTIDNPFAALIKKHPGKTECFESLNEEWKAKSDYVQAQSANFPIIADSLEMLTEYFDKYILKDKNLPKLIKNYKFPMDVYYFANKNLQLIQEEKVKLAQAMLFRLKLARTNRPDDLLLEFMLQFGPHIQFDCSVKGDRVFFNEILSPELCTQFFNYIQQIGNIKQIQELTTLYSLKPTVLPNMASFNDNCYDNFGPCSGFELHKMDFTGNFLPFKSFETWHFNNSCMNLAIFSSSKFNQCHFKNVNIQQSNFINTQFNNTYFNTINCQRTDFTGSCFSHAYLRWIDAQEAIFTGCYLDHTSFHSSNLTEAIFERVKLKNTDFSMTCLHGANFYGAIGNCNFNNADLTGASLKGFDFTKSSFQGAILRDTQFIEGCTEDEILLELNVFACRLKNHAQAPELCKAIKQHVNNIIEKHALENSKPTLLKHALFTTPEDNTTLGQFTLNFFKKGGDLISSQFSFKPT